MAKKVVEVIWTPWPLDADGKDQSVVSLSVEDAIELFALGNSVTDREPGETRALEHLVEELRTATGRDFWIEP